MQSLLILPQATSSPTANLSFWFQLPRKCPWHRGEKRRGRSAVRSPSLANRELSVEKRNLLKREPSNVSPRQHPAAAPFGFTFVSRPDGVCTWCGNDDCMVEMYTFLYQRVMVGNMDVDMCLEELWEGGEWKLETINLAQRREKLPHSLEYNHPMVSFNTNTPEILPCFL